MTVGVLSKEKKKRTSIFTLFTKEFRNAIKESEDIGASSSYDARPTSTPQSGPSKSGVSSGVDLLHPPPYSAPQERFPALSAAIRTSDRIEEYARLHRVALKLLEREEHEWQSITDDTITVTRDLSMALAWPLNRFLTLAPLMNSSTLSTVDSAFAPLAEKLHNLEEVMKELISPTKDRRFRVVELRWESLVSMIDTFHGKKLKELLEWLKAGDFVALPEKGRVALLEIRGGKFDRKLKTLAGMTKKIWAYTPRRTE